MTQGSWAGLLAGRGATAAVVILLLHGGSIAPQTEPTGPEEPTIRALAEHLSKQDMLRCVLVSHCQEQKRLFGASASRLPYIECSPAGRNTPQASSCNRAGIQTYPTWIINGRAIIGEVMTLAQLPDATGFPQASAFR